MEKKNRIFRLPSRWSIRARSSMKNSRFDNREIIPIENSIPRIRRRFLLYERKIFSRVFSPPIYVNSALYLLAKSIVYPVFRHFYIHFNFYYSSLRYITRHRKNIPIFQNTPSRSRAADIEKRKFLSRVNCSYGVLFNLFFKTGRRNRVISSNMIKKKMNEISFIRAVCELRRRR